MVAMGLICTLLAFILLAVGVREGVVVGPLLVLGFVGLAFSKYAAYSAGASE